MQKRAAFGAVLAAASIATMVAAPAAVAGPAERIESTVIDVSCVFSTSEGDLVFFFASDVNGEAGAGMFVESPDGEIILDGDGGQATFGPEFSATVMMHDSVTGEPVGEATVAATMTKLGEPTVEEIRDRDGNRWTRGSFTVTEFVVSTTSVDVPGYTVEPDAEACGGSEFTFDVFTTNPAARVQQILDYESEICQLEGLPDGEVLLRGDLRTPVFEVVVDDGVEPLKASGEIDLRGWSGSATAPLVSLFTDEVVSDLTIDVTLARAGQRQQESVTFDGMTMRISWVPYIASISVSTSDGLAGTAECYSENIVEKIIVRPHQDGDDH